MEASERLNASKAARDLFGDAFVEHFAARETGRSGSSASRSPSGNSSATSRSSDADNQGRLSRRRADLCRTAARRRRRDRRLAREGAQGAEELADDKACRNGSKSAAASSTRCSRARASSARSSPGRWAGPIRYTPGEIDRLAERARAMIALAPEALADIGAEPRAGFTRFIRHEPLGVVFVVAPWNYPYLTAVNAIVPALLAGNAVILKHSAQTPLVAERFADGFKAAGLPAGLFQVVHLSHADTERLIAAPRDRFRRVHGLGRGRPCRAARRFRPLRRHRPRARRQGPGLCAPRRQFRPRRRESRRRQLLQFGAELLRHRAHLRASGHLRPFRRRVRRPDEQLQARQSALARHDAGADGARLRRRFRAQARSPRPSATAPGR